jgi:hypothetical protein
MPEASSMVKGLGNHTNIAYCHSLGRIAGYS